MFDTNLVLNDGTVDKTFSLRSILDGKSVRSRTDAALGEPETLTISHSKRDPKNPNSSDRHLMRLDAVQNDVNGVPKTVSVYLVLENPVDGTFTATEIRTLFLRILNGFASDARWAQFVNNEP